MTLSVYTEDGHTLQQLEKLMEQRQKWLGEEAKNSVSASAIDILKSLRVLTKVANYRHTKIEIEQVSTLHLSYKRLAKKNVPCLRNGRVRYIPPKGTVVKYLSSDQNAKVFKWVYTSPNGKTQRTYLFVSDSQKVAEANAKELVKKRSNMYKGLARRALGVLMYKACTLNPSDQVARHVDAIAQMNTQVQEQETGMGDKCKYSLTLMDNLDYAMLALKNGKYDIDNAIMKASNKVAGLLNQRCKDLLGFKKIETPFPEVKRRR